MCNMRPSYCCFLFILVTAISCCLQTCLAATPTQNKSPMTNPRNDNEAGDFAYPENYRMPGGNNRNFHHIHHHRMPNHGFPPEFEHDPNFHRDDPVFPPPPPSSLLPFNEDDDDDDEIVHDSNTIYTNSSRQIPVEYVQNLIQHNVSDLLLNFVEGMEDDQATPGVILEDRFGGDSEERNAAVMPKDASCMPELQTVKIVENNDPTILYIPQCTRMERCGGCCTHSLLSCQPTETDLVSFKVIQTQYTGAKKLKFVGKKTVLVEKHTKCKCQCKVRSDDCKVYQEYKESECRCACKNFDEEKKCHKNVDMKLWNPEACACQCRQVSPCTTGFIFDQNECKCVPPKMKRRYVSPQNDYEEDYPIFHN